MLTPNNCEEFLSEMGCCVLFSRNMKNCAKRAMPWGNPIDAQKSHSFSRK